MHLLSFMAFQKGGELEDGLELLCMAPEKRDGFSCVSQVQDGKFKGKPEGNHGLYH
jgi:hypothetical protein